MAFIEYGAQPNPNDPALRGRKTRFTGTMNEPMWEYVDGPTTGDGRSAVPKGIQVGSLEQGIIPDIRSASSDGGGTDIDVLPPAALQQAAVPPNINPEGGGGGFPSPSPAAGAAAARGLQGFRPPVARSGRPSASDLPSYLSASPEGTGDVSPLNVGAGPASATTAAPPSPATAAPPPTNAATPVRPPSTVPVPPVASPPIDLEGGGKGFATVGEQARESAGGLIRDFGGGINEQIIGPLLAAITGGQGRSDALAGSPEGVDVDVTPAGGFSGTPQLPSVVTSPQFPSTVGTDLDDLAPGPERVDTQLPPIPPGIIDLANTPDGSGIDRIIEALGLEDMGPDQRPPLLQQLPDSIRDAVIDRLTEMEESVDIGGDILS